MARGRKTGTDAISKLNPSGSWFENWQVAAYGHRADDPIAEIVRDWRALAFMQAKLQADKARIGTERIKAAKREKPTKDAAVIQYWHERETLLTWETAAKRRLAEALAPAMLAGDNATIRRLAAAMEASAEAALPLHLALLEIAGQVTRTSTDGKKPVLRLGDPIDGEPCFEMPDLIKRLARDTGRKYGERQIREACRQIGFKLERLPSARKSKLRYRLKPSQHLDDDESATALLQAIGFTEKRGRLIPPTTAAE